MARKINLNIRNHTETLVEDSLLKKDIIQTNSSPKHITNKKDRISRIVESYTSKNLLKLKATAPSGGDNSIERENVYQIAPPQNEVKWSDLVLMLAKHH